MGYDLLDHTGDLGIRIWADDLGGLFCEAAWALFDIITDLEQVEVHLERETDVEGVGRDELMVAWLNELLYLHEVEGLLFRDFAVTELDEGRLKGVARGESFQEGHHVIKTCIKAVTYHQLEIKEDNGRWQAQVIFDI
ncbi:MAG: archease [Deltaproteobacteria bacterium]|nr:archease [Deltaproteobacteria bacterium]